MYIARIILVLILLSGVVSLGNPIGGTPNFLTKIKSEKAFDKMANNSNTGLKENMQVVKIVYDIYSEELYFINSKQFKYHYDFCKAVLKDNDGLYTYKKNNYGKSKNRKYYLATLLYSGSTNRYVLEFLPNDLISPSQIAHLHTEIQKNFFSENLFLILPKKAELDKENQLNKFVIKNKHNLFKAKTYQGIVLKETIGILKKVEASELENYGPHDGEILVILGNPQELPIASGVITTEFQTPLSHNSILAFNRNMPFMAYETAWTNKLIDEMVNNKVKLTVLEDTFHITPVNLSENITAPKKTDKLNKVVADYSVNQLLKVEDLKLPMVNSIGAKAANFGELYHLSKKNSSTLFSVPKGAFAIPFYFYNQHIKANNIENEIADLLSLAKNNSIKSETIQSKLEAIRQKILSSKIDTILLKNVEELVLKNILNGRARFRSSTNAEDIEGFSGAGLYLSQTGQIGNDNKPIELAIKKVWASLWSDKAFFERKLYKIDQRKIAMGILVHQSFPNELANGVAVTTDINNIDKNGITINVQKGEISVVTPPSNVKCDQILSVSNEISENNFKYLSVSNQNNGKPILTDLQLQLLVDGINLVTKHYDNNNYYSKGKALDIEFKLILDERNNKSNFVFKQVRPFNY